MSHLAAPAWVHQLLDDWAGQAQTGTLEVVYLNGLVKKVNRSDVLAAPPETFTPLETPALRMQCPTCRVPFAREHDYGQKFDCAQCGVTWSIWEIRRRVQGASQA